MMIIPISTEEFADKIFRSVRSARRIIESRIYKDKPLLVQQGKSTRGGTPPYLVLWDTETNQPATGDNHEVETAPATRLDRKDSCEGKQQGQAGRGLPTVLMARPPENQDFGTPAKNSTHLTDLSSVLTAENSSSTAETVDSVGSHFFKPASFKKLAKNAEKNAQERDNKRMDAVLDKVFGDSNVFSIIPCVSADGLPVSIQEPSARYEAESRLAEPNSVISIETQTATLPIAPASQLSIAVNQDFHPESFDCQMHYVLRLIENQKLGKVCRSNALTAYFATVYIHESLRAAWESLTNNVQRTKFAAEHNLKGEIPARLKADGNPKSMTGRKSTVPLEAIEWIKKTVNEWESENKNLLASTRERTIGALAYFCKEEIGIVLSEKQVANVVKKHNLRWQMDKPEGTAGKKIAKEKGTYPRLPVNSLWLMDGCVPELLYIRGVTGKPAKITCIGIEDVGSRVLLGFREYYSESAESAVDLDKQVFIQNQFKKGTSGSPVVVTKRPDKGAGFMSQGAACAFALNKVYAAVHHFLIDFKEANAGSPIEKAHLESSWKAVHSFYKALVRRHFGKLGKIEKTPIVSNFKRGLEQSALYLDITLEELRASGIAEKFRSYMNNKRRKFREDNKDLRFVPMDRWNRYLSGTTLISPELKKHYKWARFVEEIDEKAPIAKPDPSTIFILEESALEMLNVFGYAKHDATVKPDMTIQYKVGYNVPRDLGFSVTRSTAVRVSEMPDGTGRLAIFTAKEKLSKTKHDFGAEFLGFATVKQIGGNQEKAKHIQNTKDKNSAKVLEIAKQETIYSLILKEVQPFLISFGSSDDQRMLDNLVAMKLTPELAKLWVEDICIDKQTAEIIHIEFKRFNFEARKRLQNILVLPVQKQRNVR